MGRGVVLTGKINLLDFGAAREFSDEFIAAYCRLLTAAADGDVEKVRDYSVKLGYLTGNEPIVREFR